MTTGLSARTALLRWGLFAIGVGIVLGSTAPIAFDALGRLMAVAPDKLAWVTSRLLAFLAYAAVAGAVIWGLLLSTRILDVLAHRAVSLTLHKYLAAIGLGLGGVHGALLGLDHWIGLSLVDLVVPFASPYRPVWVGIGQVTLYVLGVVYASFYVRRWIGQRAWRILHYLTFLTYVGATAHGVLAGSDSGSMWAWWTYVGTAAVVTFLLAYRIMDSIFTRLERRAPKAVAVRGEMGMQRPALVAHDPDDRDGGIETLPVADLAGSGRRAAAGSSG